MMAGKRIGRPIKRALSGERPSLGLRVTAATKALIETLARASGRTQSAEVEFLIERCIQFDRILVAMRVTERELFAAQARFVTLEPGKRAPSDNDPLSTDSARRQPPRGAS
jgi:hypothetical protein